MITGKTNILELKVRDAISYVFDDFRLDVKRRELLKNGKPVPLTHKAYQVLLILVQNSEQTVEKEYIYKQLWGDSFVEDANLTQHIYVLRKTLGQTSSGDSYIETVARAGYRFTEKVTANYPPTFPDAFTRTRNGSAEPALKREPVPFTEPHLRLAEKPTEAPETEPDSVVEDAKTESPSAAPPPNRKRIILVVALAAIAALIVALAIYFRPQVTTTNVPIRSLAVLPFKPIGEESKNEKLGLGMADSIITHLSKLQQIPVRPTSSVIRYIDSPQSNSVAAGAEMGVETVLEGTVQRDGERIRVSVQLIDVATGKPIWAENFDEPFTDIFAVQDSISQRVARAFAINLTQQQEKLMSSGSTDNIEATKAYQTGLYLHSTRSKENLLKAEEFFKQAIQHDPKFAKAYAMLADTYNMQRYYRFAEVQETRAKGLDAATRALELDATTAEAYIAMANLQVGGKDGLAGSKRLLEKAIELSPYNSTARLRYAWVIFRDDRKAASENMRLAVEYDPVSGVTNGAYCNLLTFERRYDEAIKYCEKSFDVSPDSVNAGIMLADAYSLAGRHDDAVNTIQKVINGAEEGEKRTAMGSLAYYYLRMGRRKDADPIIARLKSEVKRYPEALIDLVVLCYEIGQRAESMKYLEEAYKQQRISGLMIDYNPIWEKVNADPEVSEIFRRNKPVR